MMPLYRLSAQIELIIGRVSADYLYTQSVNQILRLIVKSERVKCLFTDRHHSGFFWRQISQSTLSQAKHTHTMEYRKIEQENR